MSHFIIGTAGHVDHGKTTLIKALTGIDTDRLKEEKKRGITIELGFAYLIAPDSERIGIIDVPGHEKFIRNMLAGAGSIDIALLVVAADEGVMPQTREHLDILSLLGISRGVVALTKCDMVDREWLELVELDLHEMLEGSFFEDAPIIPVSSYTGEGLDALKEEIFSLVAQSTAKNEAAPFRLPVDRVFSVDGFGTVVTGTLIEGQLPEGGEITVYPSMQSAKARSVQVHGQSVDMAHAGQRVAINLAGLKCHDLDRGAVLAAPESMDLSYLLDVRLDILKHGNRIIKNHSRLHFYHGTRDILCNLVLLEKDDLLPGESGYAQLRLSEPVAAKPDDHYVLRFYSPMETVGGGVIIDPSPQKHRRRDEHVISQLKLKEHGSLTECIAAMIQSRSYCFPDGQHISRTLFSDSPTFEPAVDSLCAESVLYRVGDSRLIHRSYLESLGMRCEEILSVFHQDAPLQKGMRRDELRGRLLPELDRALADEVIDLLENTGYLKTGDNRTWLPSFSVVLSESQQKLSRQVEELFLDGAFATPSYDNASEQFSKEKKLFKQVFDALVENDTLIMLTPQIFIHRQYYENAKEQFIHLARDGQPVTLAAFRDALNTSRKYAVALLEHFDLKGLTKIEGEARVLA